MTSLDNYIKTINVTEHSMIKCDIEGAEMLFLDGAKNYIKTHKPIIAISIYHRAEDFRQIPQFILQINPQYSLYFIHYSEGISESVMFFL